MSPARDTFRNASLEAAINRRRVVVASLLVIAVMALLVWRYYGLQIQEFDRYLTQSERNRVRLETVPPKRGLIYDRRGRLLASNEPSHRLGIVVERVDDLDALVAKLGDMVDLSPEDIERFHSRRDRRRPYDPVPLKLQLNDREMALIAVNRHDLPGVTIEAQLTRRYPYGALFAHVLGYVSRINERELNRIDEDVYRGTIHIGKVGLERRYESVLHGKPGYRNVETNAHGRVLRVLDEQPPSDGSDLRLALDIELQLAADAALGDQRGAVVAIDPRTGGILALVSKPSFDSNLFVNGISNEEYGNLRDSPDTPLLNRTVQGQYPPGSTVKPMLGLAGLERGLVTTDSTVPDPGWYRLPGNSRRYRDWILRIRGTGHAPQVDLRMAIAESCDVYYYDLAHRMGIDAMAESLSPYGFGRPTGVDTTSERAGILPSTEWKRGALGQPWYPGETLSAGIGQGYMLSTPLQLAQATMVIANRGESFVPSLVQRVDSMPVSGVRRPSLHAEPEHWSAVVAGMMDVVHQRRGTASRISRNLPYTIAGKTGTSQVIGIAQDAVYDEEEVAERHRHHGWFAAFAPVDEPEIVVVVLAENGGGSSAAYPVARSVMDAWFGVTPDV